MNWIFIAVSLTIVIADLDPSSGDFVKDDMTFVCLEENSYCIPRSLCPLQNASQNYVVQTKQDPGQEKENIVCGVTADTQNYVCCKNWDKMQEYDWEPSEFDWYLNSSSADDQKGQDSYPLWPGFEVLNPSDGDITPNCLGCICESGTKCNISVTCISPWPEAYWCGPFLISWAYWSDAGKPVLAGDDPTRKGAFEACVQDVDCSVNTVKAYMTRFKQDCNDDGRIDCEDYVRIHRNGGYGCKAPIEETQYYKNFQTCKNIVPTD
ncbi:hypothetical protein QYM36_016427 [Artemia franciscana]|uniref:lysozyme n=2 Tax=Artemia franciscana TaxID=6661 RepID=A0AA88L3E8_ARTSF|nr:hypothetical protein QYM36_016427 [Artemia franciscana]